jgi:hypothetical protein
MNSIKSSAFSYTSILMSLKKRRAKITTQSIVKLPAIAVKFGVLSNLWAWRSTHIYSSFSNFDRPIGFKVSGISPIKFRVRLRRFFPMREPEIARGGATIDGIGSGVVVSAGWALGVSGEEETFTADVAL